jgi:hypothetical protein
MFSRQICHNLGCIKINKKYNLISQANNMLFLHCTVFQSQKCCKGQQDSFLQHSALDKFWNETCK